jgi:hypothetical protein
VAKLGLLRGARFAAPASLVVTWAMGLRRPAREHLPRIAVAAIVVVGAVVSLWLNLPGHLSYDSVVQLAEGRVGIYTGEHPLVMSWLLGLADRLSPGAALFVLLDTLLIFGALLALVLMARPVSWLAAPLAAVCICLPQLAIYPGIVWKDVLFAGASAAGFACLAWAAAVWARVGVRYALLAGGLALLTLAALSRQNGAVVLPCAAIAVGWIAAQPSQSANSSQSSSQSARRRLALAHGAAFLAVGAGLFAAISAALALRLETPGATEEAWAALQTYDIVAAAVREPGIELRVLKARAPMLERLLRTQAVAAYSPIRVDTLQPVFDQMDAGADAPIAAQWRELIARHPWLYLRIRATAFRWVFLTPDPSACGLVFTGVDGPPQEMAQAGLRTRKSAVDDALDDYAMAFAPTPAFSHATYAAVGLILLIVLLRRRQPPDIAVAAMLASAFAFAASFALISIACDYRYLYDLDVAVIAAALYLVAGSRHMLHMFGASGRARCSEITLKP